jgi:hypothetical protein
MLGWKDVMHRRNMLWGAVSALTAVFAASRANAAAEASSTKLKVVYHLNDLDKGELRAGQHLESSCRCGSPSCNRKAIFICDREALPIDVNVSHRPLI